MVMLDDKMIGADMSFIKFTKALISNIYLVDLGEMSVRTTSRGCLPDINDGVGFTVGIGRSTGVIGEAGVTE